MKESVEETPEPRVAEKRVEVRHKRVASARRTRSQGEKVEIIKGLNRSEAAF